MRKSGLVVVAAAGAMMVVLSLFLTAPTQGQGDKSASTFKAKCAVCHGAGGKGDSADLKTVIQDGKGKMPAYGKSLKPEEIDAMVAYIKSLK